MRNIKERIPMNLQLFAEGSGTGQTAAAGQTNQGGQTTNNAQSQNAGQTQTAGQQGQGVDYGKIQAMLDTATAKKETAVLKSYFQQQGLTEEEVSKAISDFKQTKQQQNVSMESTNRELQQKVTAAENQAKQVQVELEATKVAMTLGVDGKTLPYLLKMADFTQAWDKDGKLSAENVKAALEQVLKDVPALKARQTETSGFQIGAGREGGSKQENVQTVPQKRWNRFNN